MKRPLVTVALLYAGGLLLGRGLPAPMSWLFASAFLCGGLAFCLPRARTALLAALLVLTGWTNLASRTAVWSPFDLRAVAAASPQFVTLRGTLPQTPYQRVYESEDGERWRTIAVLEVAAMRGRTGDWQRAQGRVAVSTGGVLPPSFHGGTRVDITGVLDHPPRPAVPGTFDYRRYLEPLGVYFQLKASTADDWRLAPGPQPVRPPLTDRFGAWARRTLALGLAEEDEPLRLLWTMTLGWRTGLTGDVAQPFMRSGTMHVFAISGLHIALIAGILVALLRVMQAPRGACGLVVLPLLWFYTAVTGWQASAVRSTVMMTIIIAGWALRRPSDLLNSLAAAALVILLWEPRQLRQASFQLSFFVVLSLALFTPPIEKLLRRWLQRDPLLPAGAEPRWRRWLATPLYWLANGFATSLAAWLGSIPLIAHYFHLFTPVSLLANVLVVPLSGCALSASLASLFAGAWWPGLAGVFNHSAWLWMLWMARLSEWAALLPGGWWHVRGPSPVFLALYYGALLAVTSGVLLKSGWRRWVVAGLGALAAVWLAGVAWHRGEARLCVLPLDGGAAVFCDAPGRDSDLLVDTGDESAAEVTLAPFLRAEGVDRLPRLVVTQGDVRQMGGAAWLQTNFPPRELITSGLNFRSPHYRRLLGTPPLPGQARTHLHAGDRFGAWTVLHPAAGESYARADDGALVLLGELGGVRILLASDLGRTGQGQLHARHPELRADIVVSGLPTLGEPLNPTWLATLRPRLVVIADSQFPASRRAPLALRRRLAECGAPVWFTREAGTVTLRLRHGTWRAESALGEEVVVGEGGEPR